MTVVFDDAFYSEKILRVVRISIVSSGLSTECQQINVTVVVIHLMRKQEQEQQKKKMIWNNETNGNQ